MKINDLARDVHANAVTHGWWDDERNAAEIVALIHSEWSEALEEARAGRPLVWYKADHNFKCCEKTHCGGVFAGDFCTGANGQLNCPNHNKPEGVAVELIDGCIRILDAFEFFKVQFNDDEKTLDDLMDDAKETALPNMTDISGVIAHLHYETSMLFVASGYGLTKLPPATFLIGALGVACAWVREQGLDPLAILLEKHEFNKSRPYKHGKKF